MPVEASNSVVRLDSNSVQCFTAPEGKYIAKESIFLATPLPHPSDPPPTVINPLAPTHTLPAFHTSGMRLSTLSFTDPAPGAGLVRTQSKGGRQPSIGSSKTFGGWTTSLFNKRPSAATADAFEEEEDDYLPASPAGGVSSLPSLTRRDTLSSVLSSGDKRRKPKNSLTKNNSSYISRTIVHDTMHRRLSERSPSEVFFWANVGRSLSWLDLADASRLARQEPLAKVLFTKAHPLCHDVNQVTKGPSSLDLVLGMSSSDIIWIDFMSSKYNRINKNGDVTRAAVTEIRWLPGHDTLFIAAHADGTLTIFDREREDGGFTAQGLGQNQDPRSTDVFRIIKSHSASPTNGSTAAANNGPSAAPGLETNPIAVYKVSNSPITAIKFRPGAGALVAAITSKDGYLRLVNLTTETLTDIFPSYYAGFLCAAWSPDGRYLATGGQDDMVCLWSMEDEHNKHIVARCQGHSSWVRAVEFDPVVSDTTANSYRLGSVGDDGKLLLWDFTPKSLHRPKKHHESSDKERETAKTTLHKFVSLGETPMLLPVVSKKVYLDPKDKPAAVAAAAAANSVTALGNRASDDKNAESLCDIKFLDKIIMASGRDGRVWVWERPIYRPS
ncbi:hypothetical protein TRVA0_036S00276 [Trichomonascus vanleenenianus]|uniref:WD40 repeat domain-containing protein n=1 Tax=Trichomonascus vanleenenianus TaxID=2268995 RepID=UPI003ECA4E93